MFIKLTSMNLSEGTVFISVSQIQYVQKYENGGAILRLLGGSVFVSESASEVMEKIAEAEKRA